MSRSLLKAVKAWQQAIAKDFADRYADRSIIQQHSTTQAVIISVLTFYLCEQQSILPVGCLQSLLEEQNVSDRLYQLWQKLPSLGIAWQQDLAMAPASDRCLRQVLHSLLLGEVDLNLSIASLGQVYESLLSGGDQTGKPRKARGAYYTPSAIVDYILQNTLIQRLNQNPTDALRLLDPACGGGIFLLSAYQLLLSWHLQKYLKHSQPSTQPIFKAENENWHLTFAERSRILRAHIYGIDIDPGAIEITKLSLELQCLAGELERSPTQICDLSQNLQCDNTILRKDNSDEFDIVIGNPPYLDSEWMTMHLADWRNYCATRYQTAIGNWDLFCIFIEKSLMLCKPGGFVSLVVPNKLASADYAAVARSILTQQATLLALRDYAKTSAFSASVYPLVYVVQKSTLPDTTHQAVWYEQMQSLDQVKFAYKLQIPCTLETAKLPWGIAQTPQQSALIDRLSQFSKLAAIAQITGAADSCRGIRDPAFDSRFCGGGRAKAGQQRHDRSLSAAVGSQADALLRSVLLPSDHSHRGDRPIAAQATSASNSAQNYCGRHDPIVRSGTGCSRNRLSRQIYDADSDDRCGDRSAVSAGAAQQSINSVLLWGLFCRKSASGWLFSSRFTAAPAVACTESAASQFAERPSLPAVD